MARWTMWVPSIAGAAIALPAFAGPAGDRVPLQQELLIGTVKLVCLDGGAPCPPDPMDPGYDFEDFLPETRHSVCPPDEFGQPGICVPVVCAGEQGELTLVAEEFGRVCCNDAACSGFDDSQDPCREDVECSGGESCVPSDTIRRLEVGVQLEIPGKLSLAEELFSVDEPFERTRQCQGDSESGGLAMADWFPWRSKECVVDDGIDFTGMMFPGAASAQGFSYPGLDRIRQGLEEYADAQLELPLGSVVPVSVEPNGQAELLTGFFDGDLHDLLFREEEGETLSGAYPVDIRYALSLAPGATCPGAAPPEPCDVDGDGDVDRNDVDALFAERGRTAEPGDPYDVNGDGVVSINDSRECALACDLPDCEVIDPPPPEPQRGASCGLLGIEALVLAPLWLWRCRRRARRT